VVSDLGVSESLNRPGIFEVNGSLISASSPTRSVFNAIGPPGITTSRLSHTTETFNQDRDVDLAPDQQGHSFKDPLFTKLGLVLAGSVCAHLLRWMIRLSRQGEIAPRPYRH